MTSSFFLLLSLSTLSLLLCCQADLIADICGESDLLNPTYCSETLRSDPHSRGADLQGLGQIAIKKAKAAVKTTVVVAKSVKNKNNTGAVSVCRTVCRRAMEELKTTSQALKHWDGKSKGDLSIKLSAAATYVETCDDSFGDSAGGMVPEVKEASRIAQGLIIVVLIITNKL